MKYLSQEKFLLFIFIPALLFINLLQGSFTGLLHDEAYYWVYSQKPAFGYYDHPPMVGWLISLGRSMFAGEMGTRLATIILFPIGVYLMWFASEKKNPVMFMLSLLGLPLIVGLGFLAVPDSAIIFFCSAYFYFLKRYLQNDNFLNSFILGVVIALMLYSKYPAFIVLLMTMLACWSMLKRRSFYVVTLIVIVLYLPHIIWQINHGWVSINYQLSAHGVKYFSIKNIIEYVLGQVGMGGIVIAPIVIYWAFKELPNSLYNRALKFNIIGVLFVFLLASLRSKVEANWTSTVFVALCICAGSIRFNLYKNKPLFALCVVPVILLFIARIVMMSTFEPSSIFNRANELSKSRLVSQAIKRACGAYPIVANTYQDASKLWFYTDEFVPALHLRGRQSQFSLMEYRLDPEAKYCFVSNFELPNSISLDVGRRKVHIIKNIDLEFLKSIATNTTDLYRVFGVAK